MTTRILSVAPDSLEIVIEGRLEKTDYEHFVPLAEKRIQQHGKINLLIHVEAMRGFSPEALWADLKFDAKHYAHVRRIALVAESEGKRWLATLSKPFTKADVAFFTEADLEKARAWVLEGSDTTAALAGTG
jgi:hypothetical protein